MAEYTKKKCKGRRLYTDKQLRAALFKAMKKQSFSFLLKSSRSNRPDVFCKKDVLKNFAKFLNFVKFLRTLFPTEHLWLLLIIQQTFVNKLNTNLWNDCRVYLTDDIYYNDDQNRANLVTLDSLLDHGETFQLINS